MLSARDTIRQCIRKCMTCAKIKAQSAQHMLGYLPAARVTPSQPFLKCGVDYGGPFSIRMSNSSRAKTCKAYLCLFMCFSTREIHCELNSDLSTNAFITAFKRFISRRGKCSDIYSDCGTNFIGVKKKLDALHALFKSPNHNEKIGHYLPDEGVNWHFNPLAAPHMGGIWEAGIKSVKFHLKRIISNVILTYEELYTIIVQVEACLNSRPLSPLSGDRNDLSVLTPGHFLAGGPLNAVPETDFTSSKRNHLTRWQLTQRLLQHFWRHGQWAMLSKEIGPLGQPLYEKLSEVMLGILTNPNSNATCERIFSLVRRNKTVFRSSMNISTLQAILIAKSQITDACYLQNYDKEFLNKAKSATTVA
ncbi:uncharacterized protein LOC129219765 [Uloborus diversus]|uniref:uncharacterized protein LOC129219765 n=1 Tax=Uloborus diversus TaxID=327109 RepID=UPI00240A7D87|nr:uncharacterized protein LOC129219765 [Uloborus diversus]